MDLASTSQENITNNRLTSLDAIRGIASLMVVLCHLRFLAPSIFKHHHIIMRTIINWCTNGDAAVVTFFMLSGYVLSIPYLKNKPSPYWQFIWKRFCRIYLPYAFAITVAIFLYVPGEVKPSILNHYLMVGIRNAVELDFSTWSLVYEMRIAFVFPLLILLCRNSKISLILSVLLIVSTCRFLVAFDAYAPLKSSTFWITLVCVLRIIPYFIFGILLRKHAETLSKLIDRFSAWIILLPLCMFLFSHNGYLSIRGDVVYNTACALLIVIAVNKPAK